MLTIIITMTFTLFGCLFPLFLWIVATEERMDSGFYRFNLGLSCIIGSLAVIFFWLMDIDFHIRLSAVVWLICLLAVTQFYWGRSRVHAWVVSIPSIFGAIVFFQMLSEAVSSDYSLLFISFIGGLILTGAIFSAVLGHWYLNVVNLPIGLLRRSVKWLLLFLTARMVWDFIFVLLGDIDFNSELVPLTSFLQSFNGYFLFVALFLGTVLPFFLCFLVLRTITIHSTQSATGLLYIVVISVVMGDLFYKYYFLQFGLFL